MKTTNEENSIVPTLIITIIIVFSILCGINAAINVKDVGALHPVIHTIFTFIGVTFVVYILSIVAVHSLLFIIAWLKGNIEITLGGWTDPYD